MIDILIRLENYGMDLIRDRGLFHCGGLTDKANVMWVVIFLSAIIAVVLDPAGDYIIKVAQEIIEANRS